MYSPKRFVAGGKTLQKEKPAGLASPRNFVARASPK